LNAELAEDYRIGCKTSPRTRARTALNRALRRQARIDYASDAQSVFAVDDDDLPWAMKASVEQQVHGRVELVVEFDYDSGAEGKHIAQSMRRLPKRSLTSSQHP